MPHLFKVSHSDKTKLSIVYVSSLIVGAYAGTYCSRSAALAQPKYTSC